MSLPLKFDWYDKDGNLLAIEVAMTSVTLYDDYRLLNAIHQRFFEKYNHPMVMCSKELKYASPSHIRDYMFDVDTRELLPNRFI